MSTMKVLLLYRDSCDRDITSSVVSGGGEQFCKLIYNNFNCEVEQVPSKAEKSWSLAEKNLVQKRMVKKAEDENFDIIISNFPSSIYNGRYIAESKVPVMYIMHNRFKMRSILSRLNNLNNKGHSVFLVSEHQEKYFKEMSRKEHEIWPNDKTNLMFKVAGHIRPSYCIGDKPKIKNKFDYDCATIGRCDNQKKPLLLKEMMDTQSSIPNNKKYKTLTMTSEAQEEGMNGYYNRMYKKYKEDNDVCFNYTHKRMMSKLSDCQTYFSTWDEETFGICALEALSRGVPIVLNSDENGEHASTILTNNPKHCIIIKKNNIKELVKAIEELNKTDRQSLQDEIWEKHSFENWRNHIEDAMTKTIEKFRSK